MASKSGGGASGGRGSVSKKGSVPSYSHEAPF